MHRRGACAEKVDFDVSLREADNASSRAETIQLWGLRVRARREEREEFFAKTRLPFVAAPAR